MAHHELITDKKVFQKWALSIFIQISIWDLVRHLIRWGLTRVGISDTIIMLDRMIDMAKGIRFQGPDRGVNMSHRFPVCSDPTVVNNAAQVLSGIAKRWEGPVAMDALAKEASIATSGTPVVVEASNYGHPDVNPQGISWTLSEDRGEVSKVVLLVPRWIHHTLRPRWETAATVILIGSDATAEDAAKVLADLANRLSIWE